MPKLSPIRGRDLIAILVHEGFRVVRQKGSHVRLEHPDGRKTSVPVHAGESVRIGLLRKILRDANITPEAFNNLR
ncbi:type II toxin-antitoxin system HicA family toxin [Candidatus Gottesmanbacteria bacterium]|nr:type II toxin-antitoxin system HicA family toxin [Candidatus Gottesmanbacteria bacterium]